MTELQERIIQRISITEDEEILRDIEMILNMEDDNEPYVLSEEQIREIELSREEIRRGDFVTNEEADREAIEWLKNQ